MISHRNILSLFSNAHRVQDFFEGEHMYSFLPMAHAAERVFACYGRISGGIATYFASSTAAVLTEIREVRPTLFGSVPRLFEKAYSKVHSEVEAQAATGARALQLGGWDRQRSALSASSPGADPVGD